MLCKPDYYLMTHKSEYGTILTKCPWNGTNISYANMNAVNSSRRQGKHRLIVLPLLCRDCGARRLPRKARSILVDGGLDRETDDGPRLMVVPRRWWEGGREAGNWEQGLGQGQGGGRKQGKRRGGSVRGNHQHVIRQCTRSGEEDISLTGSRESLRYFRKEGEAVIAREEGKRRGKY